MLNVHEKFMHTQTKVQRHLSVLDISVDVTH